MNTDAPLFHNDDHDTSIQAGNAVLPRLNDIQRDVHAFFLKCRFATDEELEKALMWKYPAWSTVRKRRTELVAKGILQNSGQKRKNKNNRNMIVWSVV